MIASVFQRRWITEQHQEGAVGEWRRKLSREDCGDFAEVARIDHGLSP